MVMHTWYQFLRWSEIYIVEMQMYSKIEMIKIMFAVNINSIR